MTPRATSFITSAPHLWRTVMLVCAAAMAAPAAAQESAGDPPAHISHVEGTAVLERDGAADTAPRSMPLLAGDRVRTTDGRLEILFGDGSTLHLDAHTRVDFQSDEVIRLLEGRVRLNIVGPARQVAYRIDAPGAWVQIAQPGEYRVALLQGQDGPEIELAVLRGTADLVNESGHTPLRAGERAYASAGAAPSYAYVFNSAAWDDFDRWSEGRREQRLGVSAQYLPASVRPYAATLDHHGYWRHVPTYGYVWYPTVAVGWRPYYYGRWATLRPFGWTWIGSDPWAWPTHHFGRWGFSAGAWFWIPGRHWGPAWVSWAHAPGFVAWAPLGFDNRAVFSFVNVNVFAGRRYDPWRAWTVIPHRRFGTGFVNVNVVNITRIDANVRRSFVERPAPPDVRVAIPRSAAAIRAAGTRPGGAAAFDGERAGTSRDGRIGIRSGQITAPASGAAIRRQPATGGSTGRSAFPAPAREPRAPSATRSPREATVAPTDRGAGAALPRRGSAGRSVAVPDQASTTEAAAASSSPQTTRRSAVPVSPRTSEPVQRTAPVRSRSSGTSQSQAAPSRDPRASGIGRAPSTAAPGTNSGPRPSAPRAVPRRDGSNVAPPPGAAQPGVTRQGSSRPAPAPSSAPRVTPRAAPPAAAPPARPNTGGERRAPAQERRAGPPTSAAPPPSAAPPRGAQRSGAPARSSSPGAAAPSRSSGTTGAAPASRSRGGEASGGRAVRRGGGN